MKNVLHLDTAKKTGPLFPSPSSSEDYLLERVRVTDSVSYLTFSYLLLTLNWEQQQQRGGDFHLLPSTFMGWTSILDKCHQEYLDFYVFRSHPCPGFEVRFPAGKCDSRKLRSIASLFAKYSTNKVCLSVEILDNCPFLSSINTAQRFCYWWEIGHETRTLVLFSKELTSIPTDCGKVQA